MTIEEAIEVVKRIKDDFSDHYATGMSIENWEVEEEELAALAVAISTLEEKKKWIDAVTTTQGFDPEHLTPQDKQDIMDALNYLRERLKEDGRNDKNDP